MKSAALERVLDRYYENVDAHPGFALLADTVGAGRDDRRLGTLVLTLHDKMQCHARPEQWAAEQVALLGETGDDAAQTAVEYGAVCGSVYPVLAFLESTAVISLKKINISVCPSSL